MGLPIYVPTAAEKQKVKMRKDAFLMSGDSIFHTLQGEGNRMGKPATFVRLHGCNLACSWCDTWYTWDRTKAEYWQEPRHILVTDLAKEIEKAVTEKQAPPCNHVVFTGGEPLLQQIHIEAFLRNNPEHTAEIETNGTIMPSNYLLAHCWFNVSPKLSNSHNKKEVCVKPDILQTIAKKSDNPCFKFVCVTEKDIEEVHATYEPIIGKDQIWIMPEGISVAANKIACESIMEKTIAYGYNATVRAQNIWFGGAKRRV